MNTQKRLLIGLTALSIIIGLFYPKAIAATASSTLIVSNTNGAVSQSVNGTLSNSPYASGTVVTLTAVAANGYQFSGWSSNVTSTGNNTGTVIVSGAVTVSASFTLLSSNASGNAGKVYYVSPSGKDTNVGTSDALAWKTLQKAADTVQTGDTVIVRAGTYVGMNIFGKPSGTATQPISFLADSGAIITTVSAEGTNASLGDINLENSGGYYVLEGFNIQSDGSAQRGGIRATGSNNTQILNNLVNKAYIGIFVSNSSNVLVQGNTCTNSTDQHGIYMSADQYSTVRNNVLYGNNWDGLHMNNLVGQLGSTNADSLIEYNISHDNGLSGMDIEGLANSVFINNIIYNNTKHGMTLHSQDQANTPPTANNLIMNNTIVGNGMFGIQIQTADINEMLYNNIFYGTSSIYGSIGINGPSTGLISDYNIVVNNFSTNIGKTILTLAQWQSQTGLDKHSIISDPSHLFVNASSTPPNYHLVSSSPAIDKGTLVNTPAVDQGITFLNGDIPPATDFDGNPRLQGSAYDIGAYEYSNVTNIPNTQAPIITSQPVSQTVTTGQAAAFTVKATGMPVPSYQWQLNGANISGATSPSYSIPAVTTANSGTYKVVVTNSAGTATSNPAVLTVISPFIITPSVQGTGGSINPSTPQTVNAGGSASFAITPDAGFTIADVTINGSSIGPVSAFTFTDVTLSSTIVATFAAIPPTTVAPSITSQPVSETITVGQAASFTVVATGSPTPTYQWKLNGTSISGATNPSYSISATTAADSGSYTVVVTNSVKSVTSATAVLTVNPAPAVTVAPSITTQPVSETVTAGQAASFTVVATGTPAPSYQWKLNGANISGATSPSYSIPVTTTASSGTYTVVVTNSVKSITSAAAVLTVNPVSSSVTIWSSTSAPKNASENDGSAVEVGLKFRSDVSGTVKGVRFYKGKNNTGSHVGHLWSKNGKLLGTVVFSNETSSGWQQATFAKPISIAANTIYIISYYAPNGHYPDDQNYFATTGVNTGVLHALQDGTSGPNGVYAYGLGATPVNGWKASNYWVDVVFSH